VKPEMWLPGNDIPIEFRDGPQTRPPKRRSGLRVSGVKFQKFVQLIKAIARSILGFFERRMSQPCQRLCIVGEHTLRWRGWFIYRSAFDIKRYLSQRARLSLVGEPSRYAEGDWVQVLNEVEIKMKLDSRSRTRGLEFINHQWYSCGGVYRVEKVMRRIVDDHGRYRPISQTVLLEGVDCGGPSGTGGCGRRCPLMFRDEWLKPAATPKTPAVFNNLTDSFVRIRSVEEIRSSLDPQGKRDGLMFMPEMYQWAGKKFRVATQVTSLYESVFEYEGYAPVQSPVYILEGLHCSGKVLGPKGPCDRRCFILWHKDWLTPER